MDADWVARIGDDDLVHVECQGYDDKDFGERLFRSHLSLVLRYPRRRIQTIALWVRRPPAERQLRAVCAQGVVVHVHSIVLPDVQGELLLQKPSTSCFAPAANPGAMSVAELCDRTVRALQESRASERQWLLAVSLAATRGRYGVMVDAMRRAGTEPVISEDLVRFGERRGTKKGITKGRAQGRAEALLEFVRARGLAVTDAERERILACTDLALLTGWIARAAHASSMGELLTQRRRQRHPSRRRRATKGPGSWCR